MGFPLLPQSRGLEGTQLPPTAQQVPGLGATSQPFRLYGMRKGLQEVLRGR